MLSVFSHYISNTFFLVLLCIESTKGKTRKEKKVLSFQIFTSVWGAQGSARGKEISNEPYMTVFNRVPKVVVQIGQRNSGKGKL